MLEDCATAFPRSEESSRRKRQVLIADRGGGEIRGSRNPAIPNPRTVARVLANKTRFCQAASVHSSYVYFL